ncbi:MAG: hypothetical protein L0Y57_07660 [Beijerinckiaceae bacterium]|nr:hypothetical protein [Beijerinckiaceae bacterium]
MNKNQLTPQREDKIISAILAVGMLVAGLHSMFIPRPAPARHIDMVDIDTSFSLLRRVEEIFAIFGPVLWLLLFVIFGPALWLLLCFCALWFERERYNGRKT